MKKREGKRIQRGVRSGFKRNNERKPKIFHLEERKKE
jgi:hypothetical protein